MTNKIAFKTLHEKQKEFARAIYNPKIKRIVARCGRRWGKTTLLEQVAQDIAIKNNYKVGWFAPEYKFLTPSFSRFRRDLAIAIEASNKSEMLINFDGGGLIEMWTLDNPDAGRGRDYDFVVVDEAGLKKRGLKEVIEESIEPTLLDRDGKIVMTGTPKGIDSENYFYNACTNKDMGWLEFHYPTHSNPNLNQEAVSRLKLEKDPLVYQQEHLAEFVFWGGAAFFSIDNLLDNGSPAIMPTLCDGVYAVIDSAVKDGKQHDGTAVIYCSTSKFVGHPITILDYDIIQIEGSLLESWLPNVYRRLDELSDQCNSRYGSLGVWIEDKASGTILLQQAKRRGWLAHPIDSKLTSEGKDQRAISVSGYVYQGKIKIGKEAFDKVIMYKKQKKNHLLSQIGEFRLGDPEAYKRADDALDAFVYSISIGLGNEKGW